MPGRSENSIEKADDVEVLKRRLQASESERDLLKLMVAKLQLQLAKRNRTCTAPPVSGSARPRAA